MQSAKKVAVASLAMLLLGSSAVLAQPYGYGRYGAPARDANGDYYAPDGGHVVCGGTVNLAHIVNWTIDPATGMRITREQYLARYPWASPADWTYDCASGLWTYVGAQPGSGYVAPQAQGGDRGRGREEGRDRERDRGDRDRDNRDRDDRDRGDNR